MTVTHSENSEVLLELLVAVAVMTCPAGTANGSVVLNATAQPLRGVLTVVEPIKV